MTKAKRDCFPLLMLLTILIGLVLTSYAGAQDAQLNRVIGDWELIRVTDPSVKRTVSFTKQSGQLTGTFVDSAGQSKAITDIRFNDGAYSFRVPDLNLVFRTLKFVGQNLEGNMIDDSTAKGRVVPQAIRMSKK
jgi:hypothetical protein